MTTSKRTSQNDKNTRGEKKVLANVVCRLSNVVKILEFQVQEILRMERFKLKL